MNRILLTVFRNLIFVPYWWIRLCWYAAHTDDYPEKKKYAFLKHVDDYAIKGGNIHIDVHGAENIPRENGFMFFPNHQGLFDVLAIIKACPVPFSVVAKKEVADIPFLKQVIVNVIREVKAGRNYLIFPEGTRSKNGNHPGTFKGGSFKTATKTKCPIVPVALIDSFKAFDTGSTEHITVQVHILPPMYYEEYKDMHTTEIAEEVKRRIEKTIEENI